MAPDAPLAPVSSEILDQFVGQGPLSPEELDAAFGASRTAIIERALGGELSHHLGYPPGGARPQDATNHRNGTNGKTVLTDDGPLPIEVREIARARSSRASLPDTSDGSQDSTTRSSRCTRGA
jgi:putative transposase